MLKSPQSTSFYINLLQFFFSSLFFACIISMVYSNILVVPDGHVGFLKERTYGWAKDSLKPGYHWIWTAFIPLKWSFYLIDTTPPVVHINFKMPLRYTKYLELSNVFRTQIEIKVQYHLNQKSIIKLIKSLNENIDMLEPYIKEKINIFLKVKYFEFYKSSIDIPLLKIKLTKYINSNSQTDSFTSDWRKIFTPYGIELIKFDLLRVYVPDYSLYQAQIQNLDQFLDARRQALLKSIDAETNIYILKLRHQAELEKAKTVLELLNKNPDILEYLKYQELNPKTSIIRIESEKGSSFKTLGSSMSKKYPATNDDEDSALFKNDQIGQIPPIAR